MSTAISPFNLPSVQFLFKEKTQQLSQVLGNLQLKDIKDDASFQSTIQSTKRRIRLTPVTFQEPVVRTHRQEEKTYPATYDHPRPHQKAVYVVVIDFPFTGSPELFGYSPDGHTVSSSDTRVYQPSIGNAISVEVETPQLEKEVVIAKAKGMMQTTISLINQINPQAERWTIQMEPEIEAALERKRTELINFYN